MWEVGGCAVCAFVQELLVAWLAVEIEYLAASLVSHIFNVTGEWQVRLAGSVRGHANGVDVRLLRGG